tara:strand:- start:72796 stop:73104 length:309 start_codon:yes stop_codon:yes gene_type:complete
MKAVGRRIGMVTTDGFSVVQIWAYHESQDEMCIGTSHLSRDHEEGKSIFEVDKELLGNHFFRKANSLDIIINEDDSKKMIEHKETLLARKKLLEKAWSYYEF